MKASVGWSQEIESNHWRKLDLEIDSTDFQNILAEFDLVGVPVTSTQQWVIIELEAQRLHAWTLYRRYKTGDQDLLNQIYELQYLRDEKILALDPDEKRRVSALAALEQKRKDKN